MTLVIPALFKVSLSLHRYYFRKDIPDFVYYGPAYPLQISWQYCDYFATLLDFGT
jgi:hypothetical protein